MPNEIFNVSNRMHAVQTPIIALIADLIKKTPGTISLGQGVVYYGPPESALMRIKQTNMSADYHHYSDVEGLQPLRALISDKLKQENNIDINEARRVVVSAGANMGFMNAIMAITDPGDEVILLKPYYFNHEMAITMLNCKVVPVETDHDFQPCLEKINNAINSKTKAIVSVSPNNPSGAVYPEKTLRAINRLCKLNGIYHISDEAYEYFTYDDVKHFSVGSISGSEKHTIALYSLSKAYGFASWRIGYMLIPEHLLSPIKKIQDTNLICPTRIAQEAAIAVLNEGRSYCEAHLNHINSVRNMFYDALQRIDDICTTPKTMGSLYFLIKLETSLTSMQMAQQLIEQYKVATVPAEAFGQNDGCYLRIAYGALDKTLSNTGIQRLIDGLNGIIR